jgi:hypothetical protein
MRTLISKNTIAATTALACVFAMGSATSAFAGVTGCSASGSTQEGGAVVGAVLGGLIGNKIGGRNAAGETVAGVALGAAAGSAIGCEAQKGKQARSGYRNGSTYTHNGYRISSDVQSARYNRIGQPFVAERTVNLRAAPTSASARVGRLGSGERFQAMAGVRGSDWILVGQNGTGIGYVRRDFVSAVGY